MNVNLNEEEYNLIKKMRKDKAENEWKPRTLSEISVSERLEQFNKLYQMALDEYKYVLENGCQSKDIDNYMFEAVMQLLDKDIWEHDKQNHSKLSMRIIAKPEIKLTTQTVSAAWPADVSKVNCTKQI